MNFIALKWKVLTKNQMKNKWNLSDIAVAKCSKLVELKIKSKMCFIFSNR